MDRRDLTYMITVFAVLLVIATIAILGLWIDCIGKTQDIGFPSRFLIAGGCQIQENGHWIPIVNWRYWGTN